LGWIASCKRDWKNEPIPSLENALIGLRDDPGLRDIFRFDEMQNVPLIEGQVPSLNIDHQVLGSNTARRVDDADVLSLQEYLQRAGLSRISRETVADALYIRARERSFHPVRDYLSSLQWDRQPRLDGWLSDYLGADRSDYTKAIGSMFLKSAVARIFQTGCQCDYMLILEGNQGAGKSSACRILGGQWFSDSLPPVRYAGKDASLHLNGKWVIEIGELASAKHADTEMLKAFITRQEENFRPPYARFERRQPRQCVFIGTTNKDAYLDDPTGGRRFWPVKVGVVDTEALIRDRDQLFAEAVERFKAGERWWPDRDFEESQILPQQSARYEADAWEDPIREYLKGVERTTILQVAEQALVFQKADFRKAEENRVRSIMTSLGWAKGLRGEKGERFYYGPRQP
jgi:predicted P-loop ATPase